MISKGQRIARAANISSEVDITSCFGYNGNKKGEFCFRVKEKIIDASIESLRQEGLRFSVDVLANRLRISKKTIYRIFHNKEALAFALYEKYYADAVMKAGSIISSGLPSVRESLLRLYFDSKMMTRRDIFNKYKLNELLSAYALEQSDSLWKIVYSAFHCEANVRHEAATRTIVDGAFEKLCNDGASPDYVIERLAAIL